MFLAVYLDLPVWVRVSIALSVLGIGIWLTVYGWRGRQTFREVELPSGHKTAVEAKREKPFAHLALPGGIVVTAIGAVLLTACGSSDAEKHGYNF